MSNYFIKIIQLLFSITLFISPILSKYEMPTPTLELLSPKGFRMSIPDSPGIKLFSFHGSINNELKSLEPGDFSGDITRPTNGRWVYENRKVNLEPGDILYYWIYLQNESSGYLSQDKSVTIPLAIDSDNSRPPIRQPSTTRQPPTTRQPSITRQPITTKKPFTTSSSTSQPSPSFIDENKNGITTSKNCILSKTKVRGRSVCSGELIFEDNFDFLNLTKWKKEVRIPLDSEDADFVSFQNRPENCYIASGHLNIVPSLLANVPGFNEDSIRTGELDLGSECTGIVNIQLECKRNAAYFHILPPVVSARIRTKEFFSFIYGRVDIRARLPKGDWLFPQIFLEPLTNDYGITGYSSGQMRVAFIRSNDILFAKDGNQIDGNRVSGGVVLTTNDRYRDIWLKSSLRGDHLGNDFHTYSLIWTDESITLSIDNNEYAILRGEFYRLSKTHNITHATLWENGGYMAPFDKEFYIALGVSAGGMSDFPDNCRNGPDQKLKPWKNGHPKAELNFWNDKDSWYRTWHEKYSGLEVDYIRVWAL